MAGTPRALALTFAVLLVSGCATTTAEPEPGGDIGPIDRPTPTIALDCATLIDQTVIDSAFNPSTTAAPLRVDGTGGHYSLAGLGLEQAGALRCEWSDGGAVNEHESYLLVSVLPDAAGLWQQYASEIALFQTTADSYGDASLHSCQSSGGYDSCRIDVLVGDNWLTSVLGGLASTDAATPLIESAVAVLRGAPAAEQVWSHEAAAAPACDALVPAGVLSAELEPWERAAPTQPVLLHAGFVEAGGQFCSWRNSFSSASALTVEVSVLPGGGWAWEGYWQNEPSDRASRHPLADLGDAAWAGCITGVNCFVSVLVGDTWLDVTVNDEASDDETAVATDIARSALETIRG